jgi:hypothetical protein
LTVSARGVVLRCTGSAARASARDGMAGTSGAGSRIAPRPSAVARVGSPRRPAGGVGGKAGASSALTARSGPVPRAPALGVWLRHRSAVIAAAIPGHRSAIRS